MGQECMPCRPALLAERRTHRIKSARNPRPKIHRDVLNVNDFGPHTCVDLFNVRRALLAQFE